MHRPKLEALSRVALSYLSKNASIEMKITKALTTAMAAVALAAPAAVAAAILTAAPAHATPADGCYGNTYFDPRTWHCEDPRLQQQMREPPHYLGPPPPHIDPHDIPGYVPFPGEPGY
jgi:hypothetical protein